MEYFINQQVNPRELIKMIPLAIVGVFVLWICAGLVLSIEKNSYEKTKKSDSSYHKF